MAEKSRGRSRRTAVIVDFQPLWLEAIEHVLERIDVEVVGKAKGPSSAMPLLLELRPDLLVSGIDMAEGEMDGISFVECALERLHGLRAIIVSQRSDTGSIDRALDAGVSAYVVKGARPEDLAWAVRQVFDHTVFLNRRRPRLSPTEHLGTVGQLTRREEEILRLAAEGLSNAELANKLWVTEQTIKFHLSNVYRKLGVSNRTEASRWAIAHGVADSVSQLTAHGR